MKNLQILIGRVGKDPETKMVNDVKMAKVSLATNESYKNKNGEKVESTEWHNLVFWRGIADVVERYVRKGDLIYVEGKTTHRKYEKDGQVKYFTEVVVDNLTMLGKTDNRTQESDNPTPYGKSNVKPESDLPF